MSKFNFCLIQFLAWEADDRKKKKLLTCNECPEKDKCKEKEKEDSRGQQN